MDQRDRIRNLANQVLAELSRNMSARPEDMERDEVVGRIRAEIEEITQYSEDISAGMKEDLAEIVEHEMLGYGALQPLLDDDDITEIMVNGHDMVFVERNGMIEAVEEPLFESDDEVKHIIDRIASETNRHCDMERPDMDARLRDGSRVNAVIPPVSRCGPTLTIRKFPKHRMSAWDMVDKGSMSPEMLELLASFVISRCNVLVSGGTGSGKTTLLNVLSGFIPEHERVITIEDTAELQLTVDNWVPLESRSANADGTGAISIHRLLVDSLRMRPDRIIVGECRSDETVEMLQAMNTGHDGSITTIHANSPKDAFGRIETLVQATQNLSEKNIDKQIASALQVIVQVKRYRDGSRKISEIMALTGRLEGDIIETSTIMRFEEEGYDEAGRIVGRHVATGSPLPQQILERIELSDAHFDQEWLVPDDGSYVSGTPGLKPGA